MIIDSRPKRVDFKLHWLFRQRKFRVVMLKPIFLPVIERWLSTDYRGIYAYAKERNVHGTPV